MRTRWIIAILFCIIIFSLVFFNYVFTNKKFTEYLEKPQKNRTEANSNEDLSGTASISKLSVSKTEAGVIAEWRFKKSIHEDDPVFQPWRHSTVGEPILVRTVEEEPSYWTVPLTFKEKVIGFIDVDMNKSTPRYGVFGGTPDDLNAFPSLITFTTPEEAIELVKNITVQYPGAKVSAPVFVFDGNPGRTAWMLKVEKEGKIISRVFVDGGGFVYERKEGEISKNVSGFDIAFYENMTETEVKSILDSYNLTLPYELKYNVTYIHPVFYSIVSEDEFEELKNNLNAKEVYLRKTPKTSDGQIIVLIESILPENQTISIVQSYNLPLKKFMWVSIDYNGSVISEDAGNTLKESLWKNEKVIYLNLVTRKP